MRAIGGCCDVSAPRGTVRGGDRAEKDAILGELYHSQKPCIAISIDLMGT
jgi:hypothetical protein